MYKLEISPRSCLTNTQVEALRGTLPNAADYEYLIQEDAKVSVRTEGVLARLVINCLSKKVVTEAAKLFRTVHGDLSNRGSVIYRGAMMYRERADGSLSRSKAVPPSILQRLTERNARLGLTGPYSDILGYFDKTPREKFCRETAWSLDRPDIFEISRPLVKEVEYVNKHELHNHWKRQHDFMEGVRRLHEMGLTHVINLRSSRGYRTKLRSFHSLWLPFPDDKKDRPLWFYRRALRFYKRATSRRNAKIFVMCHHGICRSASLAYFLLRASGVTRTRAERVVLRVRPCAIICPAYRQCGEAFLSRSRR